MSCNILPTYTFDCNSPKNGIDKITFYQYYDEDISISQAIHYNFQIENNIYKNEKRYFKKLFKWMLKTDRELIKIDDWPDKFIETLDDYYKNILRSGKVINKFNL